MEKPVLILSADSVFARMLQVEVSVLGADSLILSEMPGLFPQDVALLDLDTVPYQGGEPGQVIGFTRKPLQIGEADGTGCRMILHRPFAMAYLRQELTALLFPTDGTAWEWKSSGIHPSVSASAKAGVSLDTDSRSLRYGAVSVSFSPTEFLILSRLLEEPSRPATREELLSIIGNSGGNKAEVYVSSIRRKLDASGIPLTVRNRRGVGYSIH